MKSFWFLENHDEHFYSSIYFIYFNFIGYQSTKTIHQTCTKCPAE